MLTIVNYGVGNLGSIANMLSYLGVEHCVAQEPEQILQAERLLLPGVGSFDYGMARLSAGGLVEVLQHKVMVERIPVLGICLGMQIMCASSEEGSLAGLGWISARVRRFDVSKMDEPRPVPHMGWNEVVPDRSHPVIDALPRPARFYFVHGYHVDCDDADDRLLTARYGYDFTAAIAHRNILACQFHPEKSHRFGMALLKQFAEWNHVPA